MSNNTANIIIPYKMGKNRDSKFVGEIPNFVNLIPN